MESVRIEYFVEWGGGFGNWIRSYFPEDTMDDAISEAEKRLGPTRIVEVKTITTERYMTLEFAKNERSK